MSFAHSIQSKPRCLLQLCTALVYSGLTVACLYVTGVTVTQLNFMVLERIPERRTQRRRLIIASYEEDMGPAISDDSLGTEPTFSFKNAMSIIARELALSSINSGIHFFTDVGWAYIIYY